MRGGMAVSAVVLLMRVGCGQSVASSPTFEVASVKPSQQAAGKDANSQIAFGPAGISGKNVTLKQLVRRARHPF